MQDDSRLAVVLRTAQWELDEVAFALPRGEVSHEQKAQLANTLATLANLLGAPVSGGTAPEAVPAATEAQEKPEGTGRQAQASTSRRKAIEA